MKTKKRWSSFTGTDQFWITVCAEYSTKNDITFSTKICFLNNWWFQSLCNREKWSSHKQKTIARLTDPDYVWTNQAGFRRICYQRYFSRLFPPSRLFPLVFSRFRPKAVKKWGFSRLFPPCCLHFCNKGGISARNTSDVELKWFSQLIYMSKKQELCAYARRIAVRGARGLFDSAFGFTVSCGFAFGFFFFLSLGFVTFGFAFAFALGLHHSWSLSQRFPVSKISRFRNEISSPCDSKWVGNQLCTWN